MGISMRIRTKIRKKKISLIKTKDINVELFYTFSALDFHLNYELIEWS